jgi:hypothetical protein
MPLERVRHNAADLCPLLMSHPDTTFILMHMGYPYQDEFIALAKHFPNAVVDLSFAWILNPAATTRFVTEFLTAAPATKLLTVGGDHRIIEPVVGHAPTRPASASGTHCSRPSNRAGSPPSRPSTSSNPSCTATRPTCFRTAGRRGPNAASSPRAPGPPPPRRGSSRATGCAAGWPTQSGVAAGSKPLTSSGGDGGAGQHRRRIRCWPAGSSG